MLNENFVVELYDIHRRWQSRLLLFLAVLIYSDPFYNKIDLFCDMLPELAIELNDQFEIDGWNLDKFDQYSVQAAQ